jgi:hypothetical protein
LVEKEGSNVQIDKSKLETIGYLALYGLDPYDEITASELIQKPLENWDHKHIPVPLPLIEPHIYYKTFLWETAPMDDFDRMLGEIYQDQKVEFEEDSENEDEAETEPSQQYCTKLIQSLEKSESSYVCSL